MFSPGGQEMDIMTRYRLLSLISLLMALLVPPMASAADMDWQPMHQPDKRTEVKTWVRDVKNSPVKAFRGEVEVPQDMVAVMDVLTDVAHFKDWIFHCQSAKRVSSQDQDRIYMRFDGIWPVSDRDVLFANTMSQNPDTGAITLHSQNIKGEYPEQDGYVRVPDLDNHFVVTPLPDGWTRVEFRTFIDPGGYVPVWLANMISTKAPLDTLAGLRERVKKEPYRDATPADLPDLPGMKDIQWHPSVKQEKGKQEQEGQEEKSP